MKLTVVTVSHDYTAPNGIRLTERLQAATHRSHIRAERSGIIRDLFRGQTSRTGYALLLRNLLPAYRAMELALAALPANSPVAPGAWRDLARAPALESDLAALHGPGWETTLPLLPAARRYATRVSQAARRSQAALAAHAYVRYFGDLSGGQVLRRVLSRSLGLPATMLASHHFPGVADAGATKQALRAALEALCVTEAAENTLLAEAVVAFRLNIAVSEAVALALPALTHSLETVV